MTEQPEQTDGLGSEPSEPGAVFAPDAEAAPETPVEAAPETEEPSVADIPKIDMSAVAAATEAHDAAVTQAHDNLHTRMAAAYAEFGLALDKARLIWENAYSDAKSAVGLVSELEGHHVGEQDPTTAR